MRQHKAEVFAITPWRVPVAVEDIPEPGRNFVLVADVQTRAVIARMAGLRELPRLEAEFEVTRRGAGGLHVVGRVSATVGQNCVVTLEPLANEVDEEVDLMFMPPLAVAEAAGETEADRSPADADWDEPEPLIGGVVDLGAVATEFLILGLDPYPRKPGAVFESQPQPQPTADTGPFAALAGWTKASDDR
jgi:hypothetical protein